MRLADRVRDLDFEAIRKPGRDHVLGHIASRVGRRAVHLCRILARERAAAMASHAAVGVDDDLAPRQAGIRHRAADLEPPARIHVVDRAVVQHVGRNDRLDHVLDDVALDRRVVHVLRVLRRDDHGVDPHRLAAGVLDRHLALAIRQQVVELARLAHLGQAARHLVRQRDRQRHQLGGLTAGVADHHALIAGPGQIGLVAGATRAALQRGADAGGNLGALLAKRDEDATGVGIEAMTRVGVPNVGEHLAHHILDVDVGVGRDLAEHEDQPARRRRLTGNPAHRILGQRRVEHGVGDLVANLVRVAFRHGF